MPAGGVLLHGSPVALLPPGRLPRSPCQDSENCKVQTIGNNKRSPRPLITGALLLVYGAFVCWRLLTRGVEVGVLLGGFAVCLALGALIGLIVRAAAKNG